MDLDRCDLPCNAPLQKYGRAGNRAAREKTQKKFSFLNTYLYSGGLFEWLLLQDIYGDENFHTTKKTLDILKFRPRQLLNIRLLEDG